MSGGDDGDRTHDLRLAKPALSQLSYVPDCWRGRTAAADFLLINAPAATRLTLGRLLSKKVVGPTRFELVTSRLSAGRSDQLSYGPLREEIIYATPERGSRSILSFFQKTVCLRLTSRLVAHHGICCQILRHTHLADRYHMRAKLFGNSCVPQAVLALEGFTWHSFA